jgi:hypothetical protein
VAANAAWAAILGLGDLIAPYLAARQEDGNCDDLRR